jgi:cell wall-associated NlpC family hydrolase
LSIEEVQSRIADIQMRLGTGLPTGAASLSSGVGGLSGTTSAASGAQFASSLASAVGAGAVTGAAAGPTGASIVAEAKKHLGAPYVWGGESASGMDCSGLVQLTFDKFDIHLPRVSRDQAKSGVEVAGGVKNAKPGDLIFYGNPVNHVGIYVGDGKMINAPRPGKDVRIEAVYGQPTHVRRVLPSNDVAAGAATSASAVAAVSGGSGSLKTPYASLFEKAGAKYGLKPELLAGLAKVESGFRANAVSPAGARGLMQIMPGTAKGLHVDPFDPAQAVDGAARLLKRHLKDFGSLELALAAYNAGPGAVRKYDGVPPYAETRAYVKKVVAAMSDVSQGAS